MNYKQLTHLFYQHESGAPERHLTAYITFSSFGPENTKEYPWEARTYVVSSDNKAFQPSQAALASRPLLSRLRRRGELLG